MDGCMYRYTASLTYSFVNLAACSHYLSVCVKDGLMCFLYITMNACYKATYMNGAARFPLLLVNLRYNVACVDSVVFLSLLY